MIQSALISVAVVVLLMVGWIAVQTLWRKTFVDQTADQDVLAGRNSCGNCGCTTHCTNKTNNVSHNE